MAVIKGFDDAGTLAGNGLTLVGTRYFYLSGTDRVIRAKLGKVGVHCVKTTQGNRKRSLTATGGQKLISYFSFCSCHSLCLR